MHNASLVSTGFCPLPWSFFGVFDCGMAGTFKDSFKAASFAASAFGS
jgi:hypothetical protein